MPVDVETIPGAAAAVAQGGQVAGYLPPEPQPWRTLMDLGLLRLNMVEAPPGLSPEEYRRHVTSHGRYKLTGLGWAAVIGGGWWLLRRKGSSSSED